MPAEKLTKAVIDALKPRQARYFESDGHGLYIAVIPTGVKRWVSRVKWRSTTIDVGLGEWPEVGLDEARRRHKENRAMAREGRDPRMPATMFFRDLWVDWLKVRTPGWGELHAFQVRRLGELYILPAFGNADPATITPLDVRTAFLTLWNTKRSTCMKVLSDFSQCMRHGVTLGICPTDPSRDVRTAFPRKAKTIKHRAAVTDLEGIGRLVRLCRGYPYSPTISSALQFAAWTAGRPQEVVGARWEEFDMEQALWTVPATRMKRRKEHVVPLPRQCMSMLRAMKEGAVSPFLFPSLRSKHRHVSIESLLVALRELGYAKDQMTTHGFRTTFSTTANASGLWNTDAIEAQLSHAVAGAVRSVYNRSPYLEQRKEIMQWYADLLDALADHRNVNLQSKTLEDMENQGSQDAGQAAQEGSDAGRLDGVVKIYSMDLSGGPSLLSGAPLLDGTLDQNGTQQFQTCEMDTDALTAVSTKRKE